MVLILSDNDVHNHISPLDAVTIMESMFKARATGQTVGSPRWDLQFDEGRIVFTVGAVPEGVGFRTYIRGSYTHDDQLVAVWNRHTGELKGVVVGEAIGVMRTGAIGGVAIKYMTPPNASTLALIGTGRQAFAQLQMIAAVRPLKEVRVYSRSQANRTAFCQQASTSFPNLNIFALDNAESAIRGAQIVVGATTTKTPVIQGDWLMDGAHVSTLGTKGRNTREVDSTLVDGAVWIASDSPEQAIDYSDGTILDGTDKILFDLADIVSGKIQRPDKGGTSLFMSAGLAGTEVALAAYLFEQVGQK